MTPLGLARLQLDEGLRLIVYNDSNGKPITYDTISGNASIGYGRNLASRGITQEEANYLLNNDITAIWAEISNLIPWILDVDPVRQDVVIMVEYNTGDVFAFRNMLAAIKNNQWATAATQLMNSKAAIQLKDRYTRMNKALLTGSWQ